MRYINANKCERFLNSISKIYAQLLLFHKYLLYLFHGAKNYYYVTIFEQALTSNGTTRNYFVYRFSVAISSRVATKPASGLSSNERKSIVNYERVPRKVTCHATMGDDNGYSA